MSNDPQPQQPQPQLAERSAVLREELKAWEKSFAAINGRKAGRDDIKKDRSIASKYKEYRKLRDRLSDNHNPPPESGPPIETGPSTTARERKGPPQHGHTPRRLPPSTPSRDIHPADLDPYDSPLSARKLLFANEPRTSIGPTPQRNGKVLGLFDLLEDDKADSKRRGTLLDSSSNVQVTPRKGGTGAKGHSEWKSGGLTPSARTPASSSKRRLYESFSTPSKRQKQGVTDGGGSVSDTQFATPPFLRRDRLGSGMFSTTTEDGNPIPASPVIRMPAKPPVRGLSSMLAQLRQMEDEALDDEMDVLREMEMENTGQPAKPSSSVTKSAPAALSQDNQTKPSGETSTDMSAAASIATGGSEGGEKPALGRNGKPLKVWKKRGQKRTTRRVILRPVRIKPKSNPEPTIDDSDTSGGESQATVTTDATATTASRPNGKHSSINDGDDDDEPPEGDGDDDYAPAAPTTTDDGASRKKNSRRNNTNNNYDDDELSQKGGVVVKRAAKKK
ncbi:hypothetical protein GP486_006620, partial [Trichoglossum hirsutum]